MREKICPACHAENELSGTTCDSCGYQFPAAGPALYKTCADCGALNPRWATSYHSCGVSFSSSFVLTLDEALRTGAIVRGMDLAEDEVQLGEAMAAPVRDRIIASGDEQLVRILRVLPEESFARLKGILEQP